jgi:hypothetical protein
MDVDVTLSTICGGQLEGQFQELVPKIIANLKEGQKGTISISIDIKREPDTQTMVTTSYKLSHKMPSIKKTSFCQITGDGHLKTEPPKEKPKLVDMFAATGTENKGGN